MTPEHKKQLDMYTKKVDDCVSDLKTHIDDEANNIVKMALDVTTLKTVVFGNKELGEKGMKEKVDEMHEILIQARGIGGFFSGIKGFLGIFIVIAAAIAIIKGLLK